jgi:hypothetical protein
MSHIHRNKRVKFHRGEFPVCSTRKRSHITSDPVPTQCLYDVLGCQRSQARQKTVPLSNTPSGTHPHVKQETSDMDIEWENILRDVRYTTMYTKNLMNKLNTFHSKYSMSNTHIIRLKNSLHSDMTSIIAPVDELASYIR